MNEDKVNEVVDKYERKLAAIQERHIKAIALGFVGDVCTTSIFSCKFSVSIFSFTPILDSPCPIKVSIVCF